MIFSEPISVLEAGGGPASRAQRANRAGQDTIADRNRIDRETVQQLLVRLNRLKTGLQQRLLGGDESVTAFRQGSLTALLADVDRLIAQATIDLADIAKATAGRMMTAGDSHAADALRAAQLHVTQSTPGLDSHLVTSAFDNTVDLLTVPMQQFATDVKVAVRRVTLAGDSRMAEIQRLRDKIGGSGFDSASYKAERIIRTETSRVFTQASFNRLLALTKDFPFLRKGWRATKDARTRRGHVEAGVTYARGNGIPVAQPFRLNVYDERQAKGKAATAKLIGTATLLFPLDPNAKPEGRMAAASTIMCRCNAFPDFNLAEFAEFTKAKVQVALGVPLSTPAPAAPKLPTSKTVKRTTPKVKTTVAVPKAADVVPKAAPADVAGPVGPKVSAAVAIESGYQKVKAAMDVLDSVHGDGNLPTIPAGAVNRRIGKGSLAYYAHGGGAAHSLGFTKKALNAAPNMTVFHETGHFLDHKGFGIGSSFATDSLALATAEQRAAFDGLMTALKDTKEIQTLKQWQKATIFGSGVKAGDGVVPAVISRKFITYLLGRQEVFARAYAQYVAVKSGHQGALKELRAMQAASETGTGPVAATTPYNRASVALGEQPTPGTWSYPWQWSDAEFKPVMAAFDRLLETMGWRKK